MIRVLVVVVLLSGCSDSKVAITKKKAEAFDTFCQKTRAAVESDMLALQSDDKVRQAEAVDHVFRGRLHHDDESIRMCLGEKMPDTEEWAACGINENVACLRTRAEKLFQLLGEDSKLGAKRKAGALDRFCRITRSSVELDMLSLRNNGPRPYAQIIKRISDEAINFGDESVRTCLGDRMPDTTKWSACVTTNDVACLKARSEQLYALLEKTYP